MFKSLVIDDRGELWDAASRSFADGLHASISGPALVDYVVRNLGFVSVGVNDNSVRLSLRPTVVSPIAFSALMYWLHDRPIDRVLISHFDTDWSHEMFQSRDAAVRRLTALVDIDTGDRNGDFLNRICTVDMLDIASPLRALLGAWHDSKGRLDRERINRLLETGVNGRFVVVESGPAMPGLTIREVGPGLGKSAEYWLSRTIGLRVEDQPDYAYGKWVAKLYRDVLKTGAPGLEEVDAVIAWPQQERRGYRYRRLILPYRTDTDSTTLLGATLIDPSINLRAGNGAG
ncbi:MAG: hypothetical protein AB7K67_05345 [Hyphomicrobiaceae bacterium]